MPKNCESKPFMKLQEDNSNAPILNYNMEQENCLNLYSSIEVPVEQNFFKTSPKIVPKIISLKDLDEQEIRRILLEDLRKDTSEYFGGFNLIQKSSFPIVFYEATPDAQPYQSMVGSDGTFPYLLASSPSTPLSRPEPLYNNKKGEWSFVLATKGNDTYATFTTTDIAIDELIGGHNNISVINDKFVGLWQSRIIGQKSTVNYPHDAVIDIDFTEIVKNVKQGKIPTFVAASMGKIDIIFSEYNQNSNESKKIIFIQYETMLCSYLGNYGAGRTVNTFSLLPGEKTSITMRTYRDSVKSNSLAENILDSMSEASSNSLQRAFESQKGNEFGAGLNASSSSTNTSNSHWNAGGGGGINLGIVSFGASGGGGGSSSSTNASSISSSFHTKSISNIVNSGLNQHVSETNKHRDVNINSTTSSTESSGEENTIIRELYNPNLSRTLNFVFRQLHQEHIVIHWLKNIKFRFVDTDSGIDKVVFSHNLPTLLRDILIDEDTANRVFNDIMSCVGVIFNYDENPIQFFESRQFNTQPHTNNCDGMTLTPKSDCLWLRVKNLTDTYANITVNGIILGVQTHTLRTPSVIVDSLLGQGEALDCYNTHLQEVDIDLKTEMYNESKLRNQLLEKSIHTLEEIGDPVKRAEAYKLMFNESKCCEDANEQ